GGRRRVDLRRADEPRRGVRLCGCGHDRRYEHGGGQRDPPFHAHPAAHLTRYTAIASGGRPAPIDSVAGVEHVEVTTQDELDRALARVDVVPVCLGNGFFDVAREARVEAGEAATVRAHDR